MSALANNQRVAAAAAVGLAIIALATSCDARTRGLLVNTLWLACGASAIAVPIGATLALLLFKTDLWGRKALLGVLTAMLFVPLYLYAAAWEAGFGFQGWYTLAFRANANVEPPFWLPAIWIHGVAAVPWVVWIVGVALLRVEPEMEEDALLDGSPPRVLLHVSLVRVWPSLLVATAWIAAICATEITVTDLFQIRTFAEEVYTQATLAPGLGAAIAGTVDSAPLDFWRGTLVLVLVTGWILFFGGRYMYDVLTTPQRPAWFWRWRRHRWMGQLLLWGSIVLLVALPVANLAYKAGVVVEQFEEGRVRSWSVEKLAQRVAAAPSEHLREIRWTLVCGVVAATAALLIGALVAWPGRRGRPPKMVLVTAALLLAVPGPVWGLATIAVLNWPVDSWLAHLTYWYDHTVLAPCVVQTIRALPLSIILLWVAIASIPPATLESAAGDGAGPLRQLWHIAVPQVWRSMAAVWFLAWILASGELAATDLVQPPGVTTLSSRVYRLLHYGVEDRVAAIALVMIGCVAAVTVAAAQVGGRRLTPWGRNGVTSRRSAADASGP